jgi:hypothetical protein
MDDLGNAVTDLPVSINAIMDWEHMPYNAWPAICSADFLDDTTAPTFAQLDG